LARVFVYVAIMILLWGSHSPVATLSMTHGGADALSRHALLFYKLLCGATCLFIVILFTGRLRTLRSYPPRHIAKLVFAGVFGYFFYYFFLFWCLELAEPKDAITEATVINYLFPMFTLLASAAIIGEKLTVRGVVSGVVCFFGAYYAVSEGDLTRSVLRHPDIDLLAVLAAASWGLFTAMGRRWRHEILTGIFIFILTGLAISGCVLLFTGGRRYPVGWEIYGVFHVGFLCNTLGVILWFAALKRGGASLVGNLSLLTAFVNLLFIRLLLPEQSISKAAGVGLAIIVVGVLLSRTGKPLPVEASEPVEPPG